MIEYNFPFPSVVHSGRNDKGQLGHGDTKRLDAPKLVEGLGEEVVVAAACGRNHTLALTGRVMEYRKPLCGSFNLPATVKSLTNFCSDFIMFPF